MNKKADLEYKSRLRGSKRVENHESSSSESDFSKPTDDYEQTKYKAKKLSIIWRKTTKNQNDLKSQRKQSKENLNNLVLSSSSNLLN